MVSIPASGASSSELPSSPQPLFGAASRTAPWRRSNRLEVQAQPSVANVMGSVTIPQITVGKPSYSVEPAAVSSGFRTFPFRPATVVDGWATDRVTIRGASLRGHSHCHNGAPRQDDFVIHHLPGGRVIVAVADGVSAAHQSHIGAGYVTRYAAEWLRANLDTISDGTDWLALYKHVAWALAEQAQALFGLAEADPVRAEMELATTLICAVIDPIETGGLRAHLTGVGDSGAWLLSAGEFVTLLGGKVVSDTGIASAAVTALPQVPNALTSVVVDFADTDVLLIGSDGIGDPLGDGQGGVGNLLRELVGRASPPTLIEFAHAVDFSREMFDDDRTLVAVWPKSGA